MPMRAAVRDCRRELTLMPPIIFSLLRFRFHVPVIAARVASCLGLVLLIAFSANAETLTGLAVGVADGDTITVLDGQKQQHKIRVAGIDAPEKKQAFGARSKQGLSDLVYGKSVAVEWEKRDRYGRIVGKVMVDKLDAGLAQITSGLAWHYKQYEKEQSAEDRERYAYAEVKARAQRAGLWQDRHPVPPWEYRHVKRRAR
jgi:endonuclease YncB( thermonuclease family)